MSRIGFSQQRVDRLPKVFILRREFGSSEFLHKNGARMKVVLLALSGDSAREKLAQLYPDASIESISRAEFETGSVTKALASLRARPDVFAISTERLAWQRGQNLFMIFGALAGRARSS